MCSKMILITNQNQIPLITFLKLSIMPQREYPKAKGQPKTTVEFFVEKLFIKKFGTKFHYGYSLSSDCDAILLEREPIRLSLRVHFVSEVFLTFDFALNTVLKTKSTKFGVWIHVDFSF